MRIIGINGSPRKNRNTAQLVDAALRGAASRGAEVQRIDLYDLQYRGCVSCYACKRKDGVHGVCAQRDELTPVLEQITQADGLIVGTPMYYMDISSATAAFWERMLYSNSIYSNKRPSVFPKSIPVGLIYNMNLDTEGMQKMGVVRNQSAREYSIGATFHTKPRTLWVGDTYQFDDYALYESDMFSEPAKAAHRDRQFPLDLQAAFDLGAWVADTAEKQNK